MRKVQGYDYKCHHLKILAAGETCPQCDLELRMANLKPPFTVTCIRAEGVKAIEEGKEYIAMAFIAPGSSTYGEVPPALLLQITKDECSPYSYSASRFELAEK